eukprot:Gb_08359 [translate_table: standard]
MVIFESPNHLVSLNPSHWIFQSVFHRRLGLPLVIGGSQVWRLTRQWNHWRLLSKDGWLHFARQLSLSLFCRSGLESFDESLQGLWVHFPSPIEKSPVGCNSSLSPSGHPSTAKTAIEDL